MPKIYGVVYKAINKINNKSYIGQTTQSLNKRISNHVTDAFLGRDNMYFHKAIKKYGKDNFEWEIVGKYSSLDELNEAEKYFIRKYNTFKNGYNLTEGGEGLLGCSGKLAPMYGRHLSKEAKQKIGTAHKGSKRSKESKRKMSEAKKGKKLSKKHKEALKGLHRGNNSVLAKKYMLITPEGENILIHGLIEFCKTYEKDDLNYKSLSACATGKYKQHKGYRCRYYKSS